jgi:tRNA U34 2-thiouridine synthase MnmA/TrmU
VSVGDESLLLCDSLVVHATTWAHLPVEGAVLVQSSAHGATAAATIAHDGDDVLVRWGESQRRVSPGQSVVFYDTTDMLVLGGGIAG